MTEEEQSLRDILCWAAGADVDVSGILSVNAERLLGLISRHKLQVRFAVRAKAERPRWYTRALSIALWQDTRRVRSAVETQILAVQEITQAAQAAGLPPPIPLKGFTAYALTGDDGILRPSVDLDLLAGDADPMIALLTRLGYADTEILVRGHEAAKMHRSGLVVEVHRYVPVRVYPDALAACLDGADQPGWSFQTKEVMKEGRAIEYADFPQLTRGVAPGTERFPLPTPSLAALVLCVHSFRDYVDRGGAWLNHPVPLADLADLRDLAARLDFDPAGFRALAERTDARHSVEVAARMLEAWLGDASLPVPAGPPSVFRERDIFPQRVTWDLGVWAYSGPLENLPVRTWDSVLEALGGATAIDAAGSACAYATPGAAGTPLVTALLREVEGRRLPVRLTVSATYAGLTIQAEMPPLPPGDEDIFKLSFDDALEVQWRHNGQEHSDKSRPLLERFFEAFPSEAAVTPTEGGYRFCLSLPDLTGTGFLLTPVSVTFEAERWMIGLHTLIPLRITHG